ncbi:hypothetical protein PFISCL1PPCAC_27281, partial [Pristionchus fissidentatus]
SSVMVLPLLKSWVRTAFSPRYLLVTNTTTGTLVLATGDFLHQHSTHLKEERELTTDWKRTLRLIVFSATFFAPLNHFYYRWLDKTIIGGSRGRIVVKKIMIDTATGPVFASSYVVGINIMEGNSISAGFSEYRNKFIHFLALDAFLWMPVQALNFYFVPPSFRVLFVSCAALVDSFFFAHIKQIENLVEDEE